MNLVTIKELSEFLKVKTSTIYGWVHSGTVPFIKLNGLLRFDMDEILEWVKSSKPMSPTIPKSLKKSSHLDVDAIVKRAVASARQGRYNPPTPASGRQGKRETGLDQGPKGKEGGNGAL